MMRISLADIKTEKDKNAEKFRNRNLKKKPAIGEEQYVPEKGLTRVIDFRKITISWTKFIIFILIVSLILLAVYFIRINTLDKTAQNNRNRSNAESQTSVSASLTPIEKNVDPDILALNIKLDSLSKRDIDAITTIIRNNINPSSEIPELQQGKNQASYDLIQKDKNEYINTFNHYYPNDSSVKIFNEWEKNIKLIIDYSVSLKENNIENQKKLQNQLNEFPSQFSEILKGIISDINTENLTQILKSYNENLMKYTEQYFKKDYITAQTSYNEAVNKMSELSKLLSSSISKQFPEKF